MIFCGYVLQKQQPKTKQHHLQVCSNAKQIFNNPYAAINKTAAYTKQIV